jgi:Putative MetA-pathway of phenol degradation
MKLPLASLKALSCTGVGLALAFPMVASAGDPIVTDRPDFVESSDVVGPDRFQIETGFAVERTAADGVKSRTRTTPTLLRLGLNETIELRVETDGLVRSTMQDTASGATQRERGFSDASLGVKWRMREGDEALGTPGIAWLAHLDVDSGSSAFRGQGVRPSLRAVAEWDLPNDFSVGVMPGLMVDRGADDRRFVAGILAVTVGKAWTPVWRTFVELAGQQLAAKKHGGSVVTFDAGVTCLVTDSVQLDFSVARGLTAQSPDFQWGVGLSIRF